MSVLLPLLGPAVTQDTNKGQHQHMKNEGKDSFLPCKGGAWRARGCSVPKKGDFLGPRASEAAQVGLAWGIGVHRAMR